MVKQMVHHGTLLLLCTKDQRKFFCKLFSVYIVFCTGRFVKIFLTEIASAGNFLKKSPALSKIKTYFAVKALAVRLSSPAPTVSRLELGMEAPCCARH